jgi:site-specific recombinase XerD
MWFDTTLDRYIRPAADHAGIQDKGIGWHTFRRSLGSLLAASGEKVKVVQELLRHANSKITMELYQQPKRAIASAIECPSVKVHYFQDAQQTASPAG